MTEGDIQSVFSMENVQDNFMISLFDFDQKYIVKFLLNVLKNNCK